MDSILNSDKIKIVYDNWIDFGNGVKQPLPNGLHPIVSNLMKEKFKENHNLHQTIVEVNSLVKGTAIPFDHSNFWGYTVHQIEFIDISDVDENADVVYVWPLEVKGTLSYIYGDINIEFNNEQIRYQLHSTINPKLLDLLCRGKVKVLINLAQDPVNNIDLARIEQYFIRNTEIKTSDIIFVSGNDCIDEYKEQYPNYNLKISPAPLLITQQYANMLFSYPRTTSLGYISDVVREEDLDETKLRKHKFLCLNRTMKPHRYVLAYHALKNNLLQNNIYSFLNSFNATDESITSFLTRFLPKSHELIGYSKQIKEMIPYEIDTHGLTESQRCEMTADNNRKDIYSNTYLNIVSETGFEVGVNPFISEKIWKPIINLQPFILVGNHHTLKYIKELGFKTFSPFIDESYDNVQDYKQRMELLLKEIDRINAMSMEEIHNWYYSITDILIHNRNHLHNFKDINPYQVVIDDIINTYRG